MSQLKYDILNGGNANMKTSLKNALDKIDGIQEVSIDLAGGSVEVGFGDPAEEAQIKNCITGTGFRIS